MNVISALGLSHEEALEVIKQADKPYGKTDVGIYLNNKYIGVKTVEFDENGNACLPESLLREFKFKPDLIVLAPGKACLDSKKISQLKIQYNRNENAIAIDIADFYLEKDSQFNNIQVGGFGTFFNYNANLNHSSGRGGQSDSLTSLIGWGANFKNVLLRTDFSYSHFSPSWGKSYSRKSLNSAWLETDIADAVRLRGGYIGVGNSLFGAGQIHGFTLENNVNMHGGDTTVSVSGVASGYAQVEVYQQGKVIFSRPVPAGPFLFDAVPLFSAYADAEVVISEQSGGEQRYTIPRAAFSVSRQMASRFSLFAGQTDPSRGAGKVPVFGTEYRLPFYGYVQPYAGTMLAHHYSGLGAGLYANLIPHNAQGNISVSVSRGGKNKDSGQKISSNLSKQWGTVSPYLSLNWQSYHYRDLGESLQTFNDYYPGVRFSPHYSVSTGISRPFGSIGSGISFSHYASWNTPAINAASIFGSYSSRHYTLSASLTYGWQLASERSNTWTTTLNLSIPFQNGGKSGSLSSYVNHYQNNSVFGISARQVISDNLNVGMGVDKYTGNGNSTRHFAQAFWKTPYANTSVYYSGSDQNSHNYSTNLSGSIVNVGKNIVFSSAPVQDTFALINTGVKGYTTLTTPTTRVITNYDGLAIVPQLFEVQTNSVDIVTKTLPDGAYVKNAHQEIFVKRGAVGKVDFSSEQERIYLVRLVSNGNSFSYGTKLFDENAELLGYTIDENILMFNQEQAEKLAKSNVRISSSSQTACYIKKGLFKLELTGDLIDVPVTCGERHAEM